MGRADTTAHQPPAPAQPDPRPTRTPRRPAATHQAPKEPRQPWPVTLNRFRRGDLDIHLVCDNYGTHKSPPVRTWLANHPRVHVHFTPTYSSWINQVERFFAYITADLLQRSDHRSVHALETDIRAWIRDWNENPKPFIWTKTADQILKSLTRLLKRINGGGH
jgi:transposase